MRAPRAALAATLACAVALTGCTNPYAVTSASSSAPSVSRGGPGELPAPAPPPPDAQSPRHPRASPREALLAFAELYVNWDYRTLTAHQRTLAEMSVGSARAAEQQAAATSSGDPAIRSGQIHNSGRVAAVAPDATRAGWWVITTLERTSGSTQYQGIPAGYHVTLARLVRVDGDYAVSEWLPQS